MDPHNNPYQHSIPQEHKNPPEVLRQTDGFRFPTVGQNTNQANPYTFTPSPLVNSTASQLHNPDGSIRDPTGASAGVEARPGPGLGPESQQIPQSIPQSIPQQPQQSQQPSGNSLLSHTGTLPGIRSPSRGGLETMNANSRPQTEEDQRFFKLAKEALVATAQAKARLGDRSGDSPSGNNISSNITNNNQATNPIINHDGTEVNHNQYSTNYNSVTPHDKMDPTLNDLFTRLQYVSSPHGNPIKHGENIRVNENGQLMIKEFYQGFPNMNTNIFQSPLSLRNDGLVGENPFASTYGNTNPTAQVPVSQPSLSSGSPLQMSNLDVHPDSSGTSPSPLLDSDRKFLCPRCNVLFKRLSDLKRHEKQHLTVPPNICERCGKGFARKDALKRHIGTATCRRNLDRKLYIDNLEALNLNG